MDTKQSNHEKEEKYESLFALFQGPTFWMGISSLEKTAGMLSPSRAVQVRWLMT